MLDKHGFDLWAEGYDKSVNVADEKDDYPFAGYKILMNSIYNEVMNKCPVKVLDIGIGTGTLAYKLNEAGNEITGIDFSDEMLKHARAKIPNARLIPHDFSQGLPNELEGEKFDFIISTYALHHLSDTEKVELIKILLKHIDHTGVILIGDIGFENKENLDKCRMSCGDDWDDDEFYFVYSEIHDKLSPYCTIKYQQISHCGCILELKKVVS
ncbi:MAG: class I SAM-dependent methyltransferase [Defluviitaleaceae bacterium]|nr:class I SAM-dependent methyltransferase [Defluviitaleaceae bacterium]